MSGNERNPPPPQVGDEELSAWLDGGLGEDGNARMADLVGSNEDLAARAARLRRIDGLVREAVPEEPVPAELLARLGLAAAAEPAPAASASAEVIELAVAREARKARVAAAAPASRLVPPGGQGRFARIAAQVLLVAGIGLGVALLRGIGGPPTPGPVVEAPYRVLGDESSAPAAANAIARFAPGTPRSQVAAAVRAAGGTLAGDPGDTGVVRLAVDPVRRDAVLARLRAEPGVVLAEPLDQVRP